MKNINLVLDINEVKQLKNASIFRTIFDLHLIWAQAAAFILIAIYSQYWPIFILSILFIGGAQHGLSLAAHEGSHFLMFNSRRINDFVSRYFFAAPVLIPFSLYRKRHSQHHEFLATNKDTKELYKRKIVGINLFFEIIKSIFFYDFFSQVISVLRRFIYSDTKNNPKLPLLSLFKKEFLFDIFSILVIQIVIFIIFLLIFNFKYYISLWILPLISSRMLFAKLRSIGEHQPKVFKVNKKTMYYGNSSTPIMRTFKSNFIEKLLFSPLNFNYHGEHHIYPYVSYQNLPKLHQMFMSDSNSSILRNYGYEIETSYSKFLISQMLNRQSK
jgi:fatty acid desaturase